MPLLDRSLPYDELLLIHPDASQVAIPALPDGYGWDPQPASRRSQWVQLMGRCGFPFSTEESQSFWDSMKASDPEAFATHHFFILAADNSLAATCSLWPGAHFDPARWRLHWVMCAPEHQGHGLAEAACRAACAFHNAHHNGEGPLYVATQAQSWAAIRLYEKLGFAPYEGDSAKASANQARTAWAQARALISERYGLSI